MCTTRNGEDIKNFPHGEQNSYVNFSELHFKCRPINIKLNVCLNCPQIRLGNSFFPLLIACLFIYASKPASR